MTVGSRATTKRMPATGSQAIMMTLPRDRGRRCRRPVAMVMVVVDAILVVAMPILVREKVDGLRSRTPEIWSIFQTFSIKGL